MLIPLALTAAGSAAQAAGQSRARSAMSQAQADERQRQQGFQGQSQNLISESLANASAPSQAGQQAKDVANRNASYQAAAAAAPAALLPTGNTNAGDQNANSIVNTESAQRGAAAQGFTSQQGAAKANLQGFADLQKQNDIYNNRMLQQQGQIGNFMQGSSSVLPYEVQAASHKGDRYKSLGDVLSLAGSAAGMGIGAGWLGGAPTAPASILNVPGSANMLNSGIQQITPQGWLESLGKLPIR